MGTSNSYVRASGILFLIVAIAHVWRAVAAVPVTIGASTVPMWTSWLAVVVTGSLAAWALRVQRRA
jgi:hypothetical protein